MKIRYGFVSNSSTCSFIIIGRRIDRDDIEDEFRKEFGLKETDNVEFADVDFYDWMDEKYIDGGGDSYCYEGIQVAHLGCNEYEFDETEMSLSEIIEMMKDIPDAKLYVGSYGC